MSPPARTDGLMNEEELQQWILRMLGAPVTKVELTECQLQDAVENARRWFAAKKGVKRVWVTTVASNQVEIELPEDIDTVLDVLFPAPPLDLSLVFSPYIIADEKVPYEVFAAPESAGIYSSLYQAFQYNETAKRILSAETDWWQQGRLLLIQPVVRNAGQLIVEYKANRVVIEQLNERDHDLVKRFALATAQKVLGLHIRGKYQSWPAAQGSVTLNAAELIEDARSEFERLEEEISGSGYPIGFMTG